MLAFGLALLVALMTSAQFVPDEHVVIHAAVESTPVHKGSLKGPGRGLGYTLPVEPPRPPSARRSRPQAPPVEPPPAPEISARSAAIEQTSQGERPAILAEVAFDALGDGFAARALPADIQSPIGAPESAARGGIDISLAVGPDHIFEILNGNMAVFTKKGKKYPSTGKLLYGPVPNNTVFAGLASAAASATMPIRWCAMTSLPSAGSS